MLAACIGTPVSTIEIEVSSNQSNYNLFSAAGSPGSAVTVVCTIDASVTLSSTATANPAFRTGGFPAGSMLKLINHGAINGYNVPSGSANGGDAIYMDEDLEIDNVQTSKTSYGTIRKGTARGSGADGYAVRLNGHTATWDSGYNSSQVKGTVG
jgi:hypothetical protein